MTIFNKFKNIFEDFVNSSDIKPPNMPRLIKQRSGNIIASF